MSDHIKEEKYTDGKTRKRVFIKKTTVTLY